MAYHTMDDRGVSRRRMLQLGSIAAVAGLSGCAEDEDPDAGNGDSDGNGDGNGGGDDDDDSDQLGERVVEPIVMEYWSNLGGNTTIKEAAAPVMQENIQETLNTDLEVAPVEFTTQIDNVIQDERTHHLSFWYHSLTPDRLDPHEMTRRFAIDWAGGNGQANPAQYASCEYSNYAVAQASAPDEERREELVHEAHSIGSEDLMSLQLFPSVQNGAVNSSAVDLEGVGDAGVIQVNPYFFIETTPAEGDTWRINAEPTDIETTNYMVHDSSSTIAQWAHLYHSTLTEYDENYDLVPMLAEDWDVEDDARTITAYLQEDMTFHNGDEITAEDVKFTFTLMWDNPGSFPQGGSPPYDSVDVIDEKTVEFNFPEPFPALVTREWPRWGILHSDSWIEDGGDEDPDGYMPDPVIGSGPFEIVDFGFGEYVETEPHDGHPVHDVDHAISVQVYREESTAVEAYLAEEVDILQGLSPGGVDRIQDTDTGFDSEIVTTQGFMAYVLYPETNYPPSKFIEFREAIGMCLDRELMNEVAFRGESKPQLYSTPLMDSHPFRPPEDMLRQMAPDATGDIEGARRVLEDAGWGWDDDDNLRYPADADLEALWPGPEEADRPQDQVPQPEDFECVPEPNEFEMTMDL